MTHAVSCYQDAISSIEIRFTFIFNLQKSACVLDREKKKQTKNL